MLMKDDKPDRWKAKARNLTILIYKFYGMYLINFSFTTSHGESVHVVRMKPSNTQWPSKGTSVLSQEQMKKVLDQWKKVVWQGHFVLNWLHGTLSINTKPQNLWLKHCLLILIIENILKSTFMRLFLRRCDEKLTAWHPDQWKKGQDFVIHYKFWGLGVMLQVLNMNERIKESAF